MTLNAALQKISEQMYRVTQIPEPTRETGRAAFLRRIQKEPDLRDVVDQACQQFAEKGTFPMADPETVFYLLDRFSEASHCGETMRTFAHMEGPWLSWLLVDYWNLAGVLRWRDRVNFLRGD